MKKIKEAVCYLMLAYSDSQVPLELPQKARDVDSTDDDGELSVDGDAASSQVYSLNDKVLTSEHLLDHQHQTS